MTDEKSKYIQVRLEERLQEKIHEAAKAAHLSVSAWIRLALWKRFEK